MYLHCSMPFELRNQDKIPIQWIGRKSKLKRWSSLPRLLEWSLTKWICFPLVPALLRTKEAKLAKNRISYLRQIYPRSLNSLDNTERHSKVNIWIILPSNNPSLKSLCKATWLLISKAWRTTEVRSKLTTKRKQKRPLRCMQITLVIIKFGQS